ncbi:hypothetical protein BJ742DRAFT_770929 [Cladochytrium replicatum]|nr:hypothetical protein BJ742DRAFT_770929 [Cladochytrium replicatum]
MSAEVRPDVLLSGDLLTWVREQTSAPDLTIDDCLHGFPLLQICALQWPSSFDLSTYPTSEQTFLALREGLERVPGSQDGIAYLSVIGGEADIETRENACSRFLDWIRSVKMLDPVFREAESSLGEDLESYENTEVSFRIGIRWLMSFLRSRSKDSTTLETLSDGSTNTINGATVHALCSGELYTRAFHLATSKLPEYGMLLESLVDGGWLKLKRSMIGSVRDMMAERHPFYECIHATIIESLMAASYADLSVDTIVSELQRIEPKQRYSPFDLHDALLLWTQLCRQCSKSSPAPDDDDVDGDLATLLLDGRSFAGVLSFYLTLPIPTVPTNPRDVLSWVVETAGHKAGVRASWTVDEVIAECGKGNAGGVRSGLVAFLCELFRFACGIAEAEQGDISEVKEKKEPEVGEEVHREPIEVDEEAAAQVAPSAERHEMASTAAKSTTGDLEDRHSASSAMIPPSATSISNKTEEMPEQSGFEPAVADMSPKVQPERKAHQARECVPQDEKPRTPVDSDVVIKEFDAPAKKAEGKQRVPKRVRAERKSGKVKLRFRGSRSAKEITAAIVKTNVVAEHIAEVGKLGHQEPELLTQITPREVAQACVEGSPNEGDTNPVIESMEPVSVASCEIKESARSLTSTNESPPIVKSQIPSKRSQLRSTVREWVSGALSKQNSGHPTATGNCSFRQEHQINTAADRVPHLPNLRSVVNTADGIIVKAVGKMTSNVGIQVKEMKLPQIRSEPLSLVRSISTSALEQTDSGERESSESSEEYDAETLTMYDGGKIRESFSYSQRVRSFNSLEITKNEYLKYSQRPVLALDDSSGDEDGDSPPTLNLLESVSLHSRPISARSAVSNRSSNMIIQADSNRRGHASGESGESLQQVLRNARSALRKAGLPRAAGQLNPDQTSNNSSSDALSNCPMTYEERRNMRKERAVSRRNSIPTSQTGPDESEKVDSNYMSSCSSSDEWEDRFIESLNSFSNQAKAIVPDKKRETSDNTIKEATTQSFTIVKDIKKVSGLMDYPLDESGMNSLGQQTVRYAA